MGMINRCFLDYMCALLARTSSKLLLFLLMLLNKRRWLSQHARGTGAVASDTSLQFLFSSFKPPLRSLNLLAAGMADGKQCCLYCCWLVGSLYRRYPRYRGTQHKHVLWVQASDWALLLWVCCFEGHLPIRCPRPFFYIVGHRTSRWALLCMFVWSVVGVCLYLSELKSDR